MQKEYSQKLILTSLWRHNWRQLMSNRTKRLKKAKNGVPLRTISRCKHVSKTSPKNVAYSSSNGENVVAEKRVFFTLQNRNKKR